MSDGEKFIKDVSSLSIFNIASSFISIFSFYFITNLLGPTEYGKYSLTISLITTVSLAAYAGVNETLLRFSAITKEKKLIKQCIKIQYLFGFIALIGFFILSRFIDNIYNKPITIIVIIGSLSFLFTPLVESVKNLSIGRRNVKNLIYLSLSNQLLLIILVVSLFFLNFKTAIAMSIVYLIVSIFNFIQAKHLLNKFDYEEDGKYNKKEVVNYIKHGFLFGIFKSIYFQSALIVGAKFIDITKIGYYSFSMSIATVSLFAITNAMHLIAVPYITTFYEKGEFKRVNSYFSATVKLGLIISIIISVVLYFFLKIFLKYLFPKYTPVITILPYIFFAYILLNLNATMVFLKAKGYIYILTIISIISTIFSIINSYILSKYFGFKGMIISLILNIIFTTGLSWYYAYKKLKLKFIIIPTKEEIEAFKLYLGLFFNKILSRFIRKNN